MDSEIKAALDDLMSAAEHYGRWCSPANLHALRDARAKANRVIEAQTAEANARWIDRIERVGREHP